MVFWLTMWCLVDGKSISLKAREVWQHGTVFNEIRKVEEIRLE